MKTPIEFKVMRIRECVAPSQEIKTPETAVEYWNQNIATAPWFDESKECFVILILNTRRRIMGHNLVTLGGLDTCFIHPREVFRPTIVAAGSAIVLMHNHPSGDPTPSEADIRATREIIRAGQLLRIDILDHVIIGHYKHASLKALGYFSL
jgi:DNA repair protein RadC